MDRRIPISLVLSATIIVSVLMMLKAATNTMSTNIMNMALFSNFRAENSGWLSSIQVVA
jgi:hypothetical protein